MMDLLDGFHMDELERIQKLCLVLKEMMAIPDLRDRLSFYGGTCLNFVHFQDVPRLSVDLDFNYRAPEGVDWELDRNDVDMWLKTAFRRAGFSEPDIRINAKWPLTTFDLRFTRERGGRGSVKVEIGYMRRIPFSASDAIMDFTNPFDGTRIQVRTPHREEIFANKWCTMLSRQSPRDLFDVATLAGLPMDSDLFRRHAVLDNLTRKEPLHRQDVKARISSIPIDDRLRNLLRGRKTPLNLHERVVDFSLSVIGALQPLERQCEEAFYEKGSLDLSWLGTDFHPDASDHPGIRWALQNRT